MLKPTLTALAEMDRDTRKAATLLVGLVILKEYTPNEAAVLLAWEALSTGMSLIHGLLKAIPADEFQAIIEKHELPLELLETITNTVEADRAIAKAKGN